MAFLKWIQEWRAPWLDDVMGLITRLGEETIFLLIGLIAYWCISKKWGFRFLIAGITGASCNQLLKGIFLIPRPWVLDPGFQIVESAREAAMGYSFPSGHTQSAACVFGMLAAWADRKWVTAVCAALILLVGFSRMYLGVHTPLDVGVGLLVSGVLVSLLLVLFRRGENNPQITGYIALGALGITAVTLFYLHLAPVTERNIAEFDAHGLKGAWKLAGAMAGMTLAWWADEKYIHFDTKAPLWAQVIKMAGGLLAVMGVRLGLKPVVNAIFMDAAFADGVRYFLMAVAGGVLWPMTFRFYPEKPAAPKTQQKIKTPA